MDLILFPEDGFGIQLTKGGSTVVNGFERHYGQINTEFVKFNKNQKIRSTFCRFYGRYEANVTSTSSLSDHWSNSILLHGNATVGEMDSNDDSFWIDQKAIK